MARLDTAAGTLTPLDLPYALAFPSHGRIVAGQGQLAYIGTRRLPGPAVVLFDSAGGGPGVTRFHHRGD